MKKTIFDTDNFIKKYLAGAKIRDLIIEFSITRPIAYRTLSSHEIKVIGKDAAAIARTKVSDSQVIELYNSCIGAEGVARKFGITREGVNAILQKNGIKLRNRSEQQFARMSITSAEQREFTLRNARAANLGCVRSTETKEQAAKTREKTLNIVISEYENIFYEMMNKRGVALTRQKAIGIYNCDFASESVAVEIWGGHWHWHGQRLATTEERFNKIMNAGFNILVIAINVASPLTDAVADYAVRFINESESNPSSSRQYRVIWRAGDDSTGGCLNDGHFSVKPPFTNARNVISGRYERVPN